MNDYVKTRLKAFGHAIDGLKALWNQPHGKIHLVIATVVLAAGFYFKISNKEWMAVVISIAIVLSAEAFNTSLEVFCDKIHPGRDSKIKKVKDLAAAAVLICAAGALVVGCLIFIPKILSLL